MGECYKKILKLMCRKIEREFGKQCTHVIVPNDSNAEDYKFYKEEKDCSHVKIVEPDWLIISHVSFVIFAKTL